VAEQRGRTAWPNGVAKLRGNTESKLRENTESELRGIQKANNGVEQRR